MNKYKLGVWLIVLAALLWAVDAPFRKFLTTDLSSTTIVFMEHILIGVLVLPLLWPRLKELRDLSWREWLAVVFIALGGSALATIFFTQSFHYVNPTVSILLQKLQPFVAIGLAAVVLKENLTKKFWLWAAVAMFGAYLVTFPDLKVTGFTLAGGTLGAVFALLAAFFWGGSTVFGRLVLRKVSFQMMTALRFLGALFFLFLIQVWYGRLGEVAAASGKDWLFVFIIAILAGFVSLFIYYKGLQNTKASIATLGELVFVPSAVIVNWIFLDASLALGQILGGLILLLAILQLSGVNARETKGAAALDAPRPLAA